MEAITTSQIIRNAISQHGLTKGRVAEHLQISRPTLDRRLSDNSFSDLEIELIKKLKVVKVI